MRSDSILEKLVPDSDLVIRYRRFMREFDKQRNVQVGLKLFLGGIGLGVVALLLFVGSWAFTSGRTFFTWVQFAYASGMLAFPLVVMSIAVLLGPNRERLRIGAAGVGLTALATLGFLWAYPDNWNGYGADYTLYIVGLYAIGTAINTFVMGISLKEHAPQLIQTLTTIRPPESYEAERSVGSSRSSSAVSDGGSEADAQTRVVLNQESDSGGDGPSEVTLVINGERYTFGDGDTFGRREESWLQDLMAASGDHEEVSYVSSEHLEFDVKGDGIYVTDLSRNGTELNGKDLNGDEAKLEDGDTLVLANRAEIDVEI